MSQTRNAMADAEKRTVYDGIKHLLASCSFSPGDRLHVPDLADHLRVSTTPIREALNRLCAQGLVTAVPQRGFFVRSLHQAEIADLYSMQHMILAFASKGAIAKLTLLESERQSLERLAAPIENEHDIVGRLAVYERHAVPMIMLIGSLAENAVMLDCLRNVIDRLHFVRHTEVRMEDRAGTVFSEAAALSQALLMRHETAVLAELENQLQREQSMLESLITECVNRLYRRGQPAPGSRNRHQLLGLAPPSAQNSIASKRR